MWKCYMISNRKLNVDDTGLLGFVQVILIVRIFRNLYEFCTTCTTLSSGPFIYTVLFSHSLGYGPATCAFAPFKMNMCNAMRSVWSLGKSCDQKWPSHAGR